LAIISAACRFPLGDAAETESVADRDVTVETECRRTGTDFLDIEKAHLAGLVQVYVQPDAVSCRDRKDPV
jgi:hypothetical protein